MEPTVVNCPVLPRPIPKCVTVEKADRPFPDTHWWLCSPHRATGVTVKSLWNGDPATFEQTIQYVVHSADRDAELKAFTESCGAT